MSVTLSSAQSDYLSFVKMFINNIGLSVYVIYSLAALCWTVGGHRIDNIEKEAHCDDSGASKVTSVPSDRRWDPRCMALVV